MLKKVTEIWPQLNATQKSELDASAQTLHFKRGESIYREGDAAQGLYFVEEGLVGLVLVGAASGKEHLVRFFKPGQFFGHRALFSQEGYHGTTKVLEATTIKMVPKRVVLQFLEKHPELYREIVLVLARELRRSEMQHVMILENQILARTAQAIVYLKDLHPDHNWTRQEIADFCASTVSTIIKAMAELEDLGLIQQDGRSFSIKNRQGLISLQDQD